MPALVVMAESLGWSPTTRMLVAVPAIVVGLVAALGLRRFGNHVPERWKGRWPEWLSAIAIGLVLLASLIASYMAIGNSADAPD